jgi:hypothetical protein
VAADLLELILHAGSVGKQSARLGCLRPRIDSWKVRCIQPFDNLCPPRKYHWRVQHLRSVDMSEYQYFKSFDQFFGFARGGRHYPPCISNRLMEEFDPLNVERVRKNVDSCEVAAEPRHASREPGGWGDDWMVVVCALSRLNARLAKYDQQINPLVDKLTYKRRNLSVGNRSIPQHT